MTGLVNPGPHGGGSRCGQPVRLPELAAARTRLVAVPVRGRPRKQGELVGRDEDLAVIGAFLDELSDHGRALLLSGEPGIGKSALLNAAEVMAAGAGIRVLRASGAEFEDAGFFGLNQLLLPLRGDFDRLDDMQRNALNVALGFSGGPACGRLVVSNAVLALLCLAASDRPLLLIVDNLQQVDRASALVLGFVARRLLGSRVGLIAAERTAGSRLSALDVPAIEIRPLDEDASARLVTTRFPDLDPRVRQRIVTEARGNPVALLEPPTGLSRPQRSALALVPREPRESGDAEQARRLAAAAYRAASVAGDLSASEALLADSRRACRDLEPSAEAVLATAFVLLHGDGDVAGAHRLLLRGLERADDGIAEPSGVEEGLLGLVAVCQLSGRAEHWESLERLVADSGSAFTENGQAAVRGALDPRSPHGWLDREVESLGGNSEPAEIVRIAYACASADRLADCRQALRRIARPGPGGGVGTPAMQAGILLALEAYQTGQWDEAWRLAEATAGLCAGHGYQLLRRQAQIVLALVAAGRGDAETAQATADEITRWAAPRRLTSLLAGARQARVLAALGQSDFAAAYRHAAMISPAGDIAARAPFAASALLDLVEAATRTSGDVEAAAHVKAVGQARLAATSPRMALLCGAAAAVTAPDDEALACFELALASGDAERWPFERARVHLLAGERLRRLRAVTPARAHLSAALDGFRRLGAPTWADRAVTALRAAGQVPPGGDIPDHQVLTPHEYEIARLAAAGLSNKEIGSRLFMSHRTVASHLYRMFPKLGITSRAALGQALPHEHV